VPTLARHWHWHWHWQWQWHWHCSVLLHSLAHLVVLPIRSVKLDRSVRAQDGELAVTVVEERHVHAFRVEAALELQPQLRELKSSWCWLLVWVGVVVTSNNVCLARRKSSLTSNIFTEGG